MKISDRTESILLWCLIIAGVIATSYFFGMGLAAEYGRYH